MVSRAAIIIAGGQGSRLGGIDKPQLSINGLSMRARVAGAAIAALGLPCRIVVVGADGSDLRAA
ncbi:NTP transferase domain-containing protein, partial [Prevotella bivia]|nr:NTP transferase domain-containing protein [Prevotella bivia]